MHIKAITVTGDSGHDYEVRVDNVTGAARCNCGDFRYNKNVACKHIAFAAQALSVRAQDAAVRRLPANGRPYGGWGH